MLEVEHLAVSYHDVNAVEDVSFAIASGQMVAVIGPNGAGKSTVFKAILGLVPASSGHMRYRSRSLHRQLRTVAYVPQRSQVDWDFPVTVWGAVMMARTRHRNRLDQKVWLSLREHSQIGASACRHMGTTRSPNWRTIGRSTTESISSKGDRPRSRITIFR
jgi:ABC-type Mn2+/Zn2+ transport system ATPase subunit